MMELLGCPACRRGLQEAAGVVVCSSCGRRYPLVADVPNLVVEPDSDPDRRAPGPIGRALESLTAIPFAYDVVQRLAGAATLFGRIRPILAQTDGALVLDAGAGTGTLESELPSG